MTVQQYSECIHRRKLTEFKSKSYQTRLLSTSITRINTYSCVTDRSLRFFRRSWTHRLPRKSEQATAHSLPRERRAWGAWSAAQPTNQKARTAELCARHGYAFYLDLTTTATTSTAAVADSLAARTFLLLPGSRTQEGNAAATQTRRTGEARPFGPANDTLQGHVKGTFVKFIPPSKRLVLNPARFCTRNLVETEARLGVKGDVEQWCSFWTFG